METFITLIRTLLKRLNILVPAALLAVGIVWYLTQDTPQKYRVEAKLYLNIQESKGISLSDDDLKQYQVHTYFQNVIELLKAEKTLELVQMKAAELATHHDNFFGRNSFGLRNDSLAIRERIAAWQNGAELKADQEPDKSILHFLQAHHLGIQQLRGNILSFRVMDSHFMKLEFTADQPEKTKVLSDLLIAALQEQNSRLAKEKIRGHKDVIEKLVEQARLDLQAKVKKLESYKVSNNIINLGEHTKAIVVYLVQLEGQRAQLLTRIASGEKGKSEVLQALREGNEITLDLTGNHEILELRDKLKSYSSDAARQALEAQVTLPLNTLDKEMQSTKLQIHSKLQELARKTPFDPSQLQIDLAGKYISYDLEAEISRKMVQIIEDEISRVTGYARKFAPHESTIGASEQDIQTAQNVYLTLLNKLNITESLEYGSGENVIDVIDAPAMPSGPEPSKRMILLAGTGLGTFIFLAGLFIAGKLLDQTISSVSRLEQRSQLPVTAALVDLKQGAYFPEGLQHIHQQQLNKWCQFMVNRKVARNELIMLTAAQADVSALETAMLLLGELQKMGLRTTLISSVPVGDLAQKNEVQDLSAMFEGDELLRNFNNLQLRLVNLAEQNDLTLLVSRHQLSGGELEFWSNLPIHWVMVYDAGKIFSALCQRMESILLQRNHLSVSSLLIRVQPEDMEEYVGEIPKKRSFIRKFFKNLISKA